MIDADYIRNYASTSYVKPAFRRGDAIITIPVRSVEADLKKIGLPDNRTPAVCSALSGKKFQEQNGIILDHSDGPRKRRSTTVIFHYRRATANSDCPAAQASHQETPEERAFRLTEKLRGLMKDEIAAHGGTEGFMRWVRSDDDEAA